MITIPKQLNMPDLRFCKVLKRNKRPFENAWQNVVYEYNNPELQKWIMQGNNYGVIGGYGNLIIVDFDNKEVQEKISAQLSETFTVKSGSGLLHKYFICDEKPDSIKILDENKNTLADIQGSGKMVVGPSCIHPCGAIYEIVNDIPISKIDYSELKALFSEYITIDEKTDVIAPDDNIKAIKDKISISMVLSSSNIDTNKNPTKCPGHSSKGGKCLSFNDMKGVWHCFHCNKGGDIFSLYQYIHNVDFKTALNQLAKKANIQLKKLNRIFNKSSTIKIDNYVDNVTEFYKQQPFFYNKQNVFWFWNNDLHKYEIVDEIDLMNELDNILGFEGQTITKGLKQNYIEAFKRVGRNKIPKNAPAKWIQFKDKAYSLESGNIYEVTSDYFFTNPIPWSLSDNDKTPIIDKYFTDWVGEKNLQLLYEVISYCCYQGYPIQTLICLFGGGRNGKSTFLRILSKFLGQENITSTELDLITGQNSSRFETFKLYKKLVCLMGETNFGILSKSTILKRLTGGDMIGFEMKGKMPFDDYSYAKLIIASNSLPSSDDTSDGFYRRWIIIDFPNQFQEGFDVITTIPDLEYNALARKVINILPKLLELGKFTNHGSIEERKTKYVMASNPLPIFIDAYCVKSNNEYIRYSELYNLYTKYLISHNRRVISRKEFSNTLDNEGYEVRKTTKKVNEEFQTDRWVEGLAFNYANYSSYLEKPSQLSSNIELMGKKQITGIIGHNSEKVEVFEERVI